MNILDIINMKWEYKPDNGDKWKVLDVFNYTIEGDCEDYSLTVLYHYICHSDWKRFLYYILSNKAQMHYVLSRGDKTRGHAVMYVKGEGWIDNWSKKFLPAKSDMTKRFGHEFKYKFKRYEVLLRLLKGLF